MYLGSIALESCVVACNIGMLLKSFLLWQQCAVTFEHGIDPWQHVEPPSYGTLWKTLLHIIAAL